MPSLTHTVKAYVDWDNNAVWTGTGEDVSARTLSVQTHRGRARVNDEFAPGTATVLLRNDSGDYSPFNAASPLYGNVVPGRAIKVEVIGGATGATFPVYYGYTQSYQQQAQANQRPAINVQALDAFDILRFGSIRIALQTSQRVDQIIAAILNAAGWSATLRDLDVANESPGYFWASDVDPLTALRTANLQELGGQIFVGNAGKVAFRQRYARAQASSKATLTRPTVVAIELRRDDLIDSTHFQRAGLSVGTAGSVVGTVTPAGRQLNPGATDPLNTIYGSFSLAASLVTAPVATTDYTANSAADGSGTDKTAQVTVSSFTAYGSTFLVTFNNADSAPVYLRFSSSVSFQVRGTPIVRSSDNRMIDATAVSPILSGQSLTKAFDYNDNASGIQGYGAFEAAVYSTWQPRPIIDVYPATNAEMETLLSLELGDRVTVTNTTGLYPTQITGDYHIEAIEWTFSPGGQASVRLTLFSRDQAGASFFQISGAVGAGQDYSQIATAAATSGYDRIAW